MRRASGRMTAVIGKRDFYNDFRKACGLRSTKELNAALELLDSKNKIEAVHIGKRCVIYISPYIYYQTCKGIKIA